MMRVSIQGVQVVRVGTEPLAKFACQGAHAGFAYVLFMRLIAENTISITRERNEKVNDLGIRHVALHEYALPSDVVMPERLHGWTRARHKRRVAENETKLCAYHAAGVQFGTTHMPFVFGMVGGLKTSQHSTPTMVLRLLSTVP